VNLGFTGTQRGLKPKQRATLRYLFIELQLHILHHGDCIGADEAAHRVAIGGGVRVIVHPPTNPKLRAFCQGGEILPEKPYLERNRDIVDAGGGGLIACPSTFTETLRSGTWTTVRYARKRQDRRIWLIFPDGTFKPEFPLVDKTAQNLDTRSLLG